MLASPINHAFGHACDRLVLFRKQFGQKGEVLHGIACIWIGLKVNDVGRRVFAKIFLERRPYLRVDSSTSVDVARSVISGERKGQDVARGGTPSRFEIDLRLLAPNENSVRHR